MRDLHLFDRRSSVLRALGVLAGLVAVAAGCNAPGGAAGAEDLGVVRLALTAPAGVGCVRVTFTGSREVVRDVTVDGAPLTTLSGLPTGTVAVSGAAYAGACGAGDPLWLSEPLSVVLRAGQPADVRIVFRKNGIAVVSTSFVDDVAGGWSEEFDGPALAAPWTQFSYAFSGTRNNGQTSPAGHSTLGDSPGHLRYYDDPMITIPAFPGRYAPMFDGQNYWYDPAHEVARPIDGSSWTLETKVSWHIVNGTNACGFMFDVSFGDGGAGSQVVDISRYRNGPEAQTSVSTAADASFIEHDSTDDRTMYFRVQRTGGVVRASRSLDGAAWTELWTKDYGTALDGLAERLAISGIAWFAPMGCYADYDYVRLTNQ